MFESLSDKLHNIFRGLSRRTLLSEDDIVEAMREVRLAMLEADVALPVVKAFISKIQEKAVGKTVLETISPGQAIAKIVNDELVEALGGAGSVPLNLDATPPVSILMIGLQGSGKTTTSSKIASKLKAYKKKKVLLVSLDIYRPAAQLQLEQLADRVGVVCLPVMPEQTPLQITSRAMEVGRCEGYDVIILDTAGRLSANSALMEEVCQIKELSSPAETLLVVDAMTGQDAVNTARVFNEKVGVSGIVLTRMDGDTRGGAALSMRAVTGTPIKFVTTGEKLDSLEEFHPERVAGRILGLGDVAGLVEKASETMHQQDNELLVQRLMHGQFNLDDYTAQLKQISKMGSVSSLINMLPGANRLKEMVGSQSLDSSVFNRHLVIISSMTTKERKMPEIIKASRKRRIAAGSGTTVQDVNRLLKQFKEMALMVKRFNKLGTKGLMRQGLGALISNKMPAPYGRHNRFQ